MGYTHTHTHTIGTFFPLWLLLLKKTRLVSKYFSSIVWFCLLMSFDSNAKVIGFVGVPRFKPPLGWDELIDCAMFCFVYFSFCFLWHFLCILIHFVSLHLFPSMNFLDSFQFGNINWKCLFVLFNSEWFCLLLIMFNLKNLPNVIELFKAKPQPQLASQPHIVFRCHTIWGGFCNSSPKWHHLLEWVISFTKDLVNDFIGSLDWSLMALMMPILEHQNQTIWNDC